MLSCAHCSYSREHGKVKYAKMGNVIRDNSNDLTYTYEIIESIKHPNYSIIAIDHDIALFKLNRDVDFSLFVAPICLPHFNIEPEKATATGWGLQIKLVLAK